MFVTPRAWAGKKRWVKARKTSPWLDVRALDATDLETWLESATSVHLWLAEIMGRPLDGAGTAGGHPGAEDPHRLGQGNDHRDDPGDDRRDRWKERRMVPAPAGHPQDQERRRRGSQDDPELLRPGDPMAEAGEAGGQSDLTGGEHAQEDVEGGVPALEGDPDDQEDRRDGGDRGQEIAPKEAQSGGVFDPGDPRT